jgi:hypothetical protein
LPTRPPGYAQPACATSSAVPKIGSVKADRLLAHCRIADTKTLGGLTDRQRGELISLLRR